MLNFIEQQKGFFNDAITVVLVKGDGIFACLQYYSAQPHFLSDLFQGNQ